MKILIRGNNGLRLLVLAALVTLAAPSGRAASASPGQQPEIVLFPFDEYGLPFNKGLLLTLSAGMKNKRQDPLLTDKPVLAIGKPGDPDYPRAYFSGTILKVGDEYRMWYTGHDGRHRQVCYAVSKDGLTWEKPKLGLVTYKQGKANNLVSLDGDHPMPAAITLVVHDPEDPDPERRFKMLREDPTPGVAWPVFAAVSADGISWKSAAGNKSIIVNQLEPSGFIKHNGVFIVNGHSNAIRHPIAGAQKRTMQTFISYDFDHWTAAAHLSFRRDNLPPRPPTDLHGSKGEQVHLGASLWDRGNVILGFYGMYSNPTEDRRTSIVDIGLVVSPNAINFHEPVPDFKIVPSLEEPDRAETRLTQGQAFQNIGNRTLFWYGIWTEVNRNGPTGVRLASWPRDRLGSYGPSPGIKDAHCISTVIQPRPGAHIYLNATGLTPDAQLQVEVLDEQLRPLPGYTAADCAAFKEKSGFRLPVTWQGKDSLAGINQPFRVRVNFVGRDSGDARLWAIYVD